MSILMLPTENFAGTKYDGPVDLKQIVS